MYSTITDLTVMYLPFERLSFELSPNRDSYLCGFIFQIPKPADAPGELGERKSQVETLRPLK